MMMRLNLDMAGTSISAAAVSGNNTHAYRYYRLNVTASNVFGGVGLLEIELAETVGGADTTLGQTATASSTFSGFSPTAAINDTISTDVPADCWASDFSNTWPQWLMVDYGATAGNWKTINQLKITARGIGGSGNETQAPKDFKLQGSDDASAWTDLITQTGQIFTGGETKTFTT